MGKMRIHTKLQLENLKVTDNSVNIGVDGRLQLKWVLKKQGVKMWISCIWLGV
jgi:hypothetical protein